MNVNMVQVCCYRLSSVQIEEFYKDKLPGIPPSNHYTVYLVKIDNPEDKLFEYSELVLIRINQQRHYPIVLLNISIASKYAAFFCDIKGHEEELNKNDLIDYIPKSHLKRLSVVLDRL